MVHTTATRLAAVVTDALEQHGISERQAADRTAIPRTTLKRKLLTGDFTVREVEALASLLDTSAAHLVAQADAKAAS